MPTAAYELTAPDVWSIFSKPPVRVMAISPLAVKAISQISSIDEYERPIVFVMDFD